jgi:class 3 adenylate cyclase
VVTFLFTDVEGSTRRWEADADGMRVALAAHDAVLHDAIEATYESLAGKGER